jgi:hypothetical protein
MVRHVRPPSGRGPFDREPDEPRDAHDAYAKYVFEDPRRAAEEFRVVFPRDLAALIDWRKLKPEPTELADAALRKRYPDLRFSTRLREIPVLIDVVFEHQSTPDLQMPVRFYTKTASLWTEATRREKQKMPPVFNILLFNGKRPWPGSLDLWTCIDGGDFLQERYPGVLPTQHIFIDDLPGTSDADIEARPQSAQVKLALLMLKHARQGDSVEALGRQAALVEQLPEEAVVQTLRYVLQADPAATPHGAIKALERPLGTRGRELVMTYGQQMEAKGERRGERRGIVRTLRRILKDREVRLTAAQSALIDHCENSAQLDRWVSAALKARSAEDLFGPTPKTRRS